MAKTLFGFQSQFWVINIIELVERLAYYGTLSVTALYFVSLGYSTGTVGLLTGFLLPLPYVTSLIAGPLSDKYGYRPTTMVAFVLYALGFALIGLSSALPFLMAGIILVGLAAGIFKPVPAASVAHTTSESQRNLGYSLYYWAINVGAFLGPLLIALFFRRDEVINYRAAFFFGAGVLGLNFVATAILFRNPTPPKRDVNALRELRGLGPILGDFRFLMLLITYSGFWFMYSMNFTFVTLYVERFIALPSWFSANLQQSINPAVIMLLGIPIGKLAGKVAPIRMMTIGISLFVTGFVVVGFTNSFAFFGIGLAIATIGELLTHPGYLSFVSRIAPKDKVAAYQSVGFIPIAVGFLVGPIVGGQLYQIFAVDANMPRLFWALVCGIGLLTISGFLLLGRAPSPTQRKRGATVALIPLAIAAILITAGSIGASATLDPDNAGTGPQQSWNGNLATGETAEFFLNLTATGTIVLNLTWSDEAAGPGQTNTPDRFRLEIYSGSTRLESSSGSNPVGGVGLIQIETPVLGANALRIVVILESSGGVTLGPIPTSADGANSWNLDSSFKG